MDTKMNVLERFKKRCGILEFACFLLFVFFLIPSINHFRESGLFWLYGMPLIFLGLLIALQNEWNDAQLEQIKLLLKQGKNKK